MPEYCNLNSSLIIPDHIKSEMSYNDGPKQALRRTSASSAVTPLLQMAMSGQLDDLDGNDLYSTNICRFYDLS